MDEKFGELSEEVKSYLRQLHMEQHLDPLEKAIFEARCLGERTKTQTDLAEEFGLTKMTIRRHEKRVLSKIACYAARDPESPLMLEAEKHGVFVRELLRGESYPLLREDRSC